MVRRNANYVPGSLPRRLPFFLAGKNISILKDLPEVDAWRLLEATSIDEIKDGIKKTWAERFLRGTGPEGWAKRLTTLGVKGYTTADIFAIQHLFDTRNCIIHTNGIARADYVKKYLGQRLERGRIRISLEQLIQWTAAIVNFVKTTDAFILKYGSTN
jgi:hypothetical protein